MGIKRTITTTVLTLVLIIISTTTAAALSCTCGDICANETGWWRDGGVFNTSGAPIQAAVNAASSGDVICVAAGSYTENVNVNKRLTLAGEGADVVTVTAASSSDHVFEVTADYVNISGFTATGATMSKSGIYLDSADHCDIAENNCSNNYAGIYLNYSSSNTLANNNASSNSDSGIYLHHSSSNTLANNTANLNRRYYGGYGIYLDDSSSNTLANNTANSNHHYGIVLDDSSSNTLANNTANSNRWVGIEMNSSSSNTLANNNASSNKDHGIKMSNSYSNTLTSNNASSNDVYGIVVRSSSNNNTLTSNNASNNYCGINLVSSSSNTLTSNTANSNNDYGIYLYDSSNNNTLLNNTANSNDDYGIYLHDSSDNLIYNNYFNNTNNAYDDGNNQWNTTKTSGTNIVGGPFHGGNYWSDYAGVDTDGDGLGDTILPYNSSGDIQNGGDLHPLMTTLSCDCGDICVDETGWWRDSNVFVTNTTPIQAAVDNANAGQTICVAAGNYTENVKVNKQITLAGEGAGVVTVTANQLSDHVIEVTADYVNISGFTATGATGSSKAGIYLNSADHCNIAENNCSNNYAGIYLNYSSSNTLANNNASSNSDQGIRLHYSSNNTLMNNIANSNKNYDYYGSGYGIYLDYSSDNTLTNNTANSNYGGYCYGIRLYSSSNNTLMNNTANSNNNFNYYQPGYGIYLDCSSGNTLTNNNANSNYGSNIGYGIRLRHSSSNTLMSNTASNNNFAGIFVSSSSNNTLTGNTANSNDDYGIWLQSSSNNTLTSNTVDSNNNDGIWLQYSSINTLANNNCSNNDDGIHLYSSSSNTLANNNCSNNDDGIHLYSSSNNTLTNNNASSNLFGIMLDDSSNYNTLTSNTANSNNDDGIHLYSSSNYNTLTSNTADSNNANGIRLATSSSNTLANNTASNNYMGIRLWASSSNTLTGNTVNSNNNRGIYLCFASSNLIYNNYFNNTVNVVDPHNNQWNITKTDGTNIIGGPYLGGNYWSDYAGVDNDGDGLGDTLLPYNSGINNGGDFHPLTAATPPTVTVVKPDGGEEIPGDSVYDITWNVTAGTYNLAADPINISYSNDSGATWDSIASNEPDDGRYSWSVPNINSSNCTVNVTARDVSGNTGSDVSNSTFTILETDNSTSATIPEGGTTTVEGPPESNTTVNVTAEGDVTVTVAYYNETPHPGATEPDGMVPKYIDIAFSNNDNVTWPIYVEVHYTDDEVEGLNESSLGLYYYKDGEWHRCNDTGVNVDENYVWANVEKEECPGSPFGTGGALDDTPPVITITTPIPDGIYTVGMTLDFSATDDESNVHTVVGDLTNTSGGSQLVDSGFAPEVGVYTLVVTANDTIGNTNVSDPVFFVVYDHAGGRATGEGWFDPDVESVLKADFEFAVMYKKDVSTGKLDFKDKDADIKLKSASIDWLVISSMSAQFQGTGTIKGEEGLYTFRVQADDYGEPGVDVDHFDIKIWNGTNTETDPCYEAKNTIVEGNIQVHTN